MKENSELSGKIETLNRERLKIIKAGLKSKILSGKGVNLISGQIDVNDTALMKDLAFQLKQEVDNLFLVIGAIINNKPALTVMISENIVESRGLNAGKIVREAGREIKGGGGGQAFYATAGGQNADGLQAAIDKAISFINEKPD